MLRGVVSELPADRLELVKRNLIPVVPLRGQTGEEFGHLVEALVRRHSPDLVWIDPLLAFIGNDVSSQKVCSKFLRTSLQPIATRTGVVFMLLHHTGKPSTDPRSRSNWTRTDLSHAALGSSELVNWSRAVVYLKPQQPGLYELIFTKRGGRAGAVNPDGTPATSIIIQHSPDKIFWKQVNPTALPAKKPGRKGFGFQAEMFAMKHAGLRHAGPEEVYAVAATEIRMAKRTFYYYWPSIRKAFESLPA